MLSSSDSWLAIELISWDTRLEGGIDRIRKEERGSRAEQFANHLLQRIPGSHLDDLRRRIEAFFKARPTFLDWYEAVFGEGEIEIDTLGREPKIKLPSLPAWQAAKAHLDPDSLLTFWISRDLPSGLSSRKSIACLERWGIQVRYTDPLLDNIVERGVADGHVHFEACDPVSVLWSRVMHSWTGMRAVTRYSKAELNVLRRSNPPRYRFRKEEARRMKRAKRLRKRIARELKGYSAAAVERNSGRRKIPLVADFLCDERLFLLAAWRYLRKSDEQDTLCRDFDRYVAAKSHFLRQHQQFPGSGGGLTRFREFLDRARTGDEASPAHVSPRVIRARRRRLVDEVLDCQHLKQLELRIAPMNSVAEYKKFFAWWRQQIDPKRGHPRLRETQAPRVGFVVHFIRKPGDATGHGSAYEFETLRRRLDRQSAALHLFRIEHSDLAKHIVGLDAANFERGCPPDLFAPYMRLLRGETNLLKGDRIRQENWYRLRDRQIDWHPFKLPRLRFTYHVGEDYYHVADGTRHMDNVARHLLTPGDRIGHGLAAGMPIRDGCGRFLDNGCLLDNLVWLRGAAREVEKDFRRKCARIEDVIRELADDIYPESAPVDFPTLERLQAARYNLPPARWLPKGVDGLARADRLFYLETYDSVVREKRRNGASAERTEILDQVADLLHAVQQKTVADIRRKGLVIEINPSSNLATDAVPGMNAHPMFRYIEETGDGGFLSINTDDPGVFCTRIDNEFALVLQEMLERYDHDRPRAAAELDCLRLTGIGSSFVDVTG